MSSSRETIHVSLGSTANAVTAHLLNLEGLAVTDQQDAPPSCNPTITHAIAKETYVPRVLIVDESKHFSPFQGNVDRTVAATWKGNVVEVQQQVEENVSAIKSGVRELQEAASTLAYSTYSRYHVDPRQSSFMTASSNGRHVQWDSDDEEEEEDEDEKKRRLQRSRQRWHSNVQEPLQEKMDSFWKHNSGYDSLSWMDYWMPPHPTINNYAVPLQTNNMIQQHWDAYTNGTLYAEELSEKLRQVLEACDSVQGVTIVTQGCGIYAGLTTSLLQELQDECRTAGRLVWNVNEDDSSPTEKENQWQPAQAKRVRNHVQSGLALSDMTTYAHVVMPLSIDSSSLFAASARMAVALETTTLPYRLSGGAKSSIGLSGGYYGGVGPSDAGYGVASHLSFGEYLACLQPSTQYPIVELDLMMSSTDGWNESIFQGTSLERERRMQQGGRDANVRRPRDVLPGEWLQDTSDGGLLTSLSPETGNKDRSLHRNFALTSSLRPTGTAFSTSQYLTQLMEGMAFRYRPEVSMGTVLNESIATLTADGYGAGSYWKCLFPKDMPALSVVSNSTRSYGFLCHVASNFETVLKRPQFRGYHARDVAQGILPDPDDCMEALEHCIDLRNLYSPPESSGLVADSEGVYFDNVE